MISSLYAHEYSSLTTFFLLFFIQYNQGGEYIDIAFMHEETCKGASPEMEKDFAVSDQLTGSSYLTCVY